MPDAPVLRAMQAAAVGVGEDNHVHYPRTSKQDAGYDWFVEYAGNPDAARACSPAPCRYGLAEQFDELPRLRVGHDGGRFHRPV